MMAGRALPGDEGQETPAVGVALDDISDGEGPGVAVFGGGEGEDVRGERGGGVHDRALDRPANGRRGRLGTGALLLAGVLLVACTTVGAYLFSASAPTVYGARAEFVYELGGEDRAADADRRILTELEVARSRAVLESVAAASNMSIAELDRSLTVERVGESGVIRFTVARQDQEEAVRLVDGIVRSYLRTSEESFAVDAELDFVTERIAELDALQTEIDTALSAAIAGGASADIVAQLQLEAQDLTVRIFEFEDRRTSIELDARNAGRVETLTPAFALDDPLGPKPARAGAFGVLVGMAIVASMAIAVAQLRQGREGLPPAGASPAP
ncbi:MAG: hypothetical protein H0V33_11330 [Acidimicrobiia bacterium]|nr:hypothetical protein [Acidimicrobiia bacterium]